MEFSREQLVYLLSHMESHIEKSVYDVLGDSVTEPQFSAVTVANLIKCYIQVMKDQGVELPYSDLQTYFQWNMIDERDYHAFMEKYDKERDYYIGAIY